MHPKIDKTEFGSITIHGEEHKRDVVIRLSGKVKKRKKKLSSRIFGTSHVISLDEAKHIYDKGARKLIVGSGQDGELKLSPEAAEYFDEHDLKVELMPTPQAVEAWNGAQGRVIAVFHVTC